MVTEDETTQPAATPPAHDDPSPADAAPQAASTLPASPDPAAWGADTPSAQPPADASTVDVAIVQCVNLLLMVRRLLFTSLGALALTAEEARDFVDRMLDRGEMAQEEVERLVDDLSRRAAAPESPAGYRNGAGEHAAPRRETVSPQSPLDVPVDALWGRLKVPTRREIEELSHKISELDRKVADLRHRRGLDAE